MFLSLKPFSRSDDEVSKRRSVLLATDLSCRCDRALDRAVALARAWAAELVVVHAVSEVEAIDDAPSWRRGASVEALATQRLRADLAGVADVPMQLVVERKPALELIVETAERLGSELIITGVARDETLGRVLLGTTVERLVRRSAVPVLVVRSRARGDYRNIVVGSDLSPGSSAALDVARRLWPSASVRALHAFEVALESRMADPMAARDATRAELEGPAQAFIAGRGVPVLLEYGRPEALLRALEDEGAELTVVGTAGRTGLAGFVIGSVAARIVAELRGDVLVVPPGARRG